MIEVKCPRVIIGAPSSGCGKSIIASGIMAWLSRRKKVQGFKVGPDYIDPMYHHQATGRVGRNLDSWMLSPTLVKKIFVRAAQKVEISVIEGVMGLFDGSIELSSLTAGLYSGSTAEIAFLLKAPIILIIDAQRMAHSAAAVLHGFHTLNPQIKISGVIFNRVNSARHAHLLNQTIKPYGIPSLGCIPKNEGLHIPERHLGLYTVIERLAEVQSVLENAANVVNEHIDMDMVMQIANQAPPLYVEHSEIEPSDLIEVNIAYAHDEAFCFYYEDNLEELKKYGANVVSFSPIYDARLPEDTHGIYFGGGYPELYSEKISSNQMMLKEIAHLIKYGLPVYAECGGLMVLTQGITKDDGSLHKFIGVLPGYTRLTKKLTMGYRKVRALQDSLFTRCNESYRGHEFHYSFWGGLDESKAAYQINPNSEFEKPYLEGYAKITS